MRFLTALATMVIAVLLVGCGAGGPKPTANADQEQGYPLTIATAYGDIVLTKKPERIVALAPNYLDLLTTLDLKADIVDGFDLRLNPAKQPAPDREVLFEVIDLQQWCTHRTGS